MAHAQSPFDTGFTAIQTLFTGTVAKVASLDAIVIGGYGFASSFALIASAHAPLPVQITVLAK